MVSKLTLAMDDSVIKKAKQYAEKNQLSLSKLVEFYFSSITHNTHTHTSPLPPITSELSGMVKLKNPIKDKNILAEALIEKYL